VFPDQFDQLFDGLGFGDVEFDRRFADIQVDLARRAPPMWPKSASAISPGPLTMHSMTAISTPCK